MNFNDPIQGILFKQQEQIADLQRRLEILETREDNFLTAAFTYGNISVVDNVVETAIAAAGVKVQVTVFDTNGPSNNVTPDHTNDHITIVDDGDYLIISSITLNSVGGVGTRAEMEVMKNNGAVALDGLHVDRNLAGGGASSGSLSMSGIAALVAGDTIEVWIENETNTQNYVVEDITLSLLRVG